MAAIGEPTGAGGIQPVMSEHNPAFELDEVMHLATHCKACPLWEHATQTVFGEGNPNAKIMLVGEQPGDKEDLAGKPFVGPAGHVLDDALEAAGIERDRVYVTNAVKHFKWIPKGPRRLHQKPNRGEIRVCSPWLISEINALHPEAIVLMGATAASALLGFDFRLTKHRGEFVRSPRAKLVLATIHPSSILRQRDEASRHQAMEGFVSDLRLVASRQSSQTL